MTGAVRRWSSPALLALVLSACLCCAGLGWACAGPTADAAAPRDLDLAFTVRPPLQRRTITPKPLQPVSTKRTSQNGFQYKLPGDGSSRLGPLVLVGAALLSTTLVQRSRVICRDHLSIPTSKKSLRIYDQNNWRISDGPGIKGSPAKERPSVRWCRRFRWRRKIRSRREGTAARPRLAVFRSLQHVYAIVVDDTVGTGVTLAASNTIQGPVAEALQEKLGLETRPLNRRSNEAAELVGADIAKKCLNLGITTVLFDRGGFKYHEEVESLAESARSAGLRF